MANTLLIDLIDIPDKWQKLLLHIANTAKMVADAMRRLVLPCVMINHIFWSTPRPIFVPMEKGEMMCNKEFAAAMRKESENWQDILLVSQALWLQIAARIEASPDPKGTEPFRGNLNG